MYRQSLPSPAPQAIVPPRSADYPARTKHAAGIVDGQLTDVTILFFTDKIMVTIIQDGRLAQWVCHCLRYMHAASLLCPQLQVPLGSTNTRVADHFLPLNLQDNSLLPMPRLTATTILGCSTPERETIGQLYATQIASAIALKNPEESRPVVIGMGLRDLGTSRERFFDLLHLVTQCI